MINNSQPVCFKKLHTHQNFARVHSTVQPEPRLLRKSCEKSLRHWREVSWGVLRQGFWVAQGFMRENGGVRGEKQWGCSDQCHSLGESGHSCSHWMDSITARWQFSNMWIWPIPCQCPQDQQRLCMCHMEKMSSPWQLVKSYLSFMCVSPEVIALHF